MEATGRAVVDAETLVRRYLDRLGPLDSRATAAAPQPDAGPPTPERIEQLRAELPPDIGRFNGRKTHGRWIDANGEVHAETSGKDGKYDEAIRLFKELKARRIPLRASDVEMKLAAHMRRNGIRSATLVINHVPCEGPLGCDALIPVILPAGYKLTVYGTDGFVREYLGGKTSTWLP
ncbi:DddA-like double-stranded DNA deaminase toxin [Amycolatopsis pigmentata]